jgi:signal transduction histidine kinase
MLEYSGLGAALESYCSEFSELTGTNAAIRAEGSFKHVPAAIALCVYRVAQEALQNVRKHAHVDRAEVTVTACAAYETARGRCPRDE